MSASRFESIRDLLWPKGPRPDVWAVLDGARSPEVYGSIISSNNNTSCLYAGELSPALERNAPHLVQLEYDDKRLTRRILDERWGQSWGIVLKCESSLDRLRRHLRTLLTVQDARGRRLLFRYYDPRVLRVFLPTCSVGELEAVYGPVDSFVTEAPEAGKSAIQFSRHQGKLTTDRFELGKAN